MTSVSAGHTILTPTQPVGSGRPQRESNPGPPHQESRAETCTGRPLIGKIMLYTSMNSSEICHVNLYNLWQLFYIKGKFY